ncbi:MAG: DUF4418 family protein [Synergistaceae bacterium]|jgi:hypothetical protein|nr:DUF4418 family protein [Synergistaceae bacterium]
MKNRVISGVAAIVLGLAIAWGPQCVFKVCEPTKGLVMKGDFIKEDSIKEGFMTCHWTAQAEIGVGMFIALLGLFLLCCPVKDVRLGVTVGIFGAGVLSLLFPHVLIGGCRMETMACRTVAFPTLSVLGVLTLAGSAANLCYLSRRRG